MEILKKVITLREPESYEPVEVCLHCGSVFKPSQKDLWPIEMPDEEIIGFYGIVLCPMCGRAHAIKNPLET